MRRWTEPGSEPQEHPKVDAFLADVLEVCRKHGFCIAHEDGHGAFIVEPINDHSMEWLANAIVDFTQAPKPKEPLDMSKITSGPQEGK